MTKQDNRPWYVVQTVELGAPASQVWQVVGGFFTIHVWHPDIVATEISGSQTDQQAIRRILTFPGQPKTTEELILMDNANFHYTYKWYHGEWGENVENYVASLRVVDSDMGRSSIVQWSSTFDFTEDAVSAFYWNGFNRLLEMYPAKTSQI